MLNAALCAVAGLPLGRRITTAAQTRSAARGFAPGTAALGKGYRVSPVYEACEASGVLPIIARREKPFVKAAATSALGPPTTAADGADFRRKRTKWRVKRVAHDADPTMLAR